MQRHAVAEGGAVALVVSQDRLADRSAPDAVGEAEDLVCLRVRALGFRRMECEGIGVQKDCTVWYGQV